MTDATEMISIGMADKSPGTRDVKKIGVATRSRRRAETRPKSYAEKINKSMKKTKGVVVVEDDVEARDGESKDAVVVAEEEDDEAEAETVAG